jgi:hypothetical protein
MRCACPQYAGCWRPWGLDYVTEVEARQAEDAAARHVNGGGMDDLLDSRQHQSFREVLEALPSYLPVWQQQLVRRGVRRWWGGVVSEYVFDEVSVKWTPESYCYPWHAGSEAVA